MVEHASQLVTKELLGPLDANYFSDVSAVGIMRLLDRHAGIEQSQIERVVHEVASAVTVKNGAAALLRCVQENPAMTPVIVSSGLDLVIQAILHMQGLAVATVSSSLSFSEGVCTGGKWAISDACKGALAAAVKHTHGVEKTIAVGHSKGDIPMLREADVSIVVDPASPEAQMIADWYAPSLEAAIPIINNACQQSW